MAQATLKFPAPEKEAETAAPSSSQSPPKAKGRLRWAVAALLAIGVGGWFAPALIGRSGLRHRLVHAVVPEYPGTAVVGGASLGWAEPVVLRDVALSDPAGGELLKIGEVRTSRSLAGLLFAQGKDLGTVTFLRPEAAVRIREDGSNLEDTLTPLLEGEGSTTGMRIVVEKGAARWGRGEETAKAGVDDVSVVVVRPPGRSVPERIEIDGRMTDGETAGDFSGSVLPAVGGGTHADLTVAAASVPIGAVQAWLDRFGVGIGVAGKGSADFVGTVALDGELAWTADGRVEGQRLWIESGSLLGGETLQVDSVVLSGKAKFAGGRLAIDGVELQSDVGTVTANASVAVAELFVDGWEERFDAVLRQDVAVVGSLDLARVASSLGPVLKLRQEVESGRAEIEVRIGERDGGRAGTVKVRTSDLVAGSPERRVTWKEPLSADVTVRRGAEGVVVERMRVESEGVTLTGSGTIRGCEARFEADLDRLRAQVERLVELPEGTLTGRASGTVTAKRIEGGAAGRVRVDVTAGVTDLSVALAGRRWAERELSLVARAEVDLGDATVGIDGAELALRSVEGDELTVRQTAAVENLRDARLAGDVTLKGDLARWAARAGAWSVPVLPTGWGAAGTADASASVAYSADEVVIDGLSAEAKSLRLTLPDRTLEEPYVRLVGSGRWNGAAGVLELPSAVLTSETASAKGTNVRLPFSGGGPATGSISFRGGAGRLARYVLPAQPPVWLSGVVGGTLELSSGAGVTNGDAQLTFEKPVLSRAVVGGDGRASWAPVWSDEQATAAVVGRYDHARDAIELRSATFASTGLGVEASGRVDRLMTVAAADVAGAVEWDLEPLAGRVSTGFPDGVAARGKSKRAFAVRGPLLAGVSPELTAQAGVGWEEVRALGLTVGAGEIAGRLERRELKFEPFDWPVAGGRVRGTAAVSFEHEPMLTVAAGRVAENLQLTPELCRTWLRYAAPSLADAAEVEGTASLDVRACGVPLLDPARMEGAGTLVVQGAEATPGPAARSILDVVRQVQVVAGRDATSGSELRLVVPAQEVRVTVTRGRVFHDRCAVRLGDESGPVVTTSGSVGFDETLDLVAEVPLDAKWFKEERVGSSLGGQTLRVPIRGTVGRPAVDPRVFQDLARKAATGAVGDAIDRQLEKQIGDPLRKLLGRGRGGAGEAGGGGP